MSLINQWHKTLRTRPRVCGAIKLAARIAIVAIALALYTLSIRSACEKRAEARYEQKLSDYIAESSAAAQTEEESPYEIWVKKDAELVARVLYGVKDNRESDLRTYCWCIFNRVDNPTFPNTLDEVVDQPNQWMRYSPNNPVLESLYQIAYNEVKVWRLGQHRPVSNEYVFMNWTPTDICLRDSFRESSGTHYWRMER